MASKMLQHWSLISLHNGENISNARDKVNKAPQDVAVTFSKVQVQTMVLN